MTVDPVCQCRRIRRMGRSRNPALLLEIQLAEAVARERMIKFSLTTMMQNPPYKTAL
jgi:hypothetical protein